MKSEIMFKLYRTMAIFVIALAMVLAWFRPQQVNYTDLLLAIIGVAGVVVTVFGIWIAVIFPRFVASLGSGVPLDKVEDAARYQVLLKSLYRAATVLIASLLVLLLISFFGADGESARVALCGFCFLAALSIGESLFESIVHGELAASNALNEGVIVGVVRRRRRKAPNA